MCCCWCYQLHSTFLLPLTHDESRASQSSGRVVITPTINPSSHLISFGSICRLEWAHPFHQQQQQHRAHNDGDFRFLLLSYLKRWCLPESAITALADAAASILAVLVCNQQQLGQQALSANTIYLREHASLSLSLLILAGRQQSSWPKP